MSHVLTETPSAPATPMDVRLGLTRLQDEAFPLRWGILGAGNISRQWVLALRGCAGASVAAVAARSLDKATQFAEQLEIASAFSSYAEMVGSADVDIVYVGTVPKLHKQHALLAINAGKHVLCEKPFTANGDDARGLYAAAENGDVMVQHGMWSRFFPAVEHARFALEQAEIGQIKIVQADFDPLYTLQAAVLAFGTDCKPEITATPHHGILEYGDHRSAVLSFPPRDIEFPEVVEFIGTRGRITLEQPGHCPTSLTVHKAASAPSRYRNQNTPARAQRFDYPLPDTVQIPDAFPNQAGFVYQAQAVHRCLSAGLRECPQFGRAESLATIDLLARYHSALRTA